jgi:hypothetical protein
MLPSSLRLAFWLALDYADDYILRHRFYAVCVYISAKVYNAENILTNRPGRIINGYFKDS